MATDPGVSPALTELLAQNDVNRQTVINAREVDVHWRPTDVPVRDQIDGQVYVPAEVGNGTPANPEVPAIPPGVQATWVDLTRDVQPTDIDPITLLPKEQLAVVRWLDPADPFVQQYFQNGLPHTTLTPPTVAELQSTLNALLANMETEDPVTGALLGRYSAPMVRSLDELLVSLRAAGVLSGITAGAGTADDVVIIDPAITSDAILAQRLATWNDMPQVPAIISGLIQAGEDARLDVLAGDPAQGAATLQHIIRFEYIQRGNELQFEQMTQLREYLTASDTTYAIMNKVQDVLMGKEAESAQLDLNALYEISKQKNSNLSRTTADGETYWIDYTHVQLNNEEILNDPWTNGDLGIGNNGTYDNNARRRRYNAGQVDPELGNQVVLRPISGLEDGPLVNSSSFPANDGAQFLSAIVRPRLTVANVNEVEYLNALRDQGFITQEEWATIRGPIINDVVRNPDGYAKQIEAWEASQFENRELKAETNFSILGYEPATPTSVPPKPEVTFGVGTVLERYDIAFGADTVHADGDLIGCLYTDPPGGPTTTLGELMRQDPSLFPPPLTGDEENIVGTVVFNHLKSKVERLADDVGAVKQSAIDNKSDADLIRNLEELETRIRSVRNDMNQAPNVYDFIKDQGVNATEQGDFQKGVDQVYLQASASKDAFNEELRRRMFEFEEYYKSASAVMNKITQILEKIAQNVGR